MAPPPASAPRQLLCNLLHTQGGPAHRYAAAWPMSMAKPDSQALAHIQSRAKPGHQAPPGNQINQESKPWFCGTSPGAHPGSPSLPGSTQPGKPVEGDSKVGT